MTKCVCGHEESEHEPTGVEVIEPSTGELVPGERCRQCSACTCFDEWAGKVCWRCGARVPWRDADNCACLP